MAFFMVSGLVALAGLASIAVGCFLLLNRNIATFRRGVGATIVAVGLLGLADLSLWATGYAPVTNRVYRLVAGAPAVRVNGKLLSYHGTFPTSPGYLKPWRGSDEGIPLYMVINPYGTVPPWIFVPCTDSEAYRYEYPMEMPWAIR